MRIREATTEDHARVAELTLAAYRTLREPMSPRYERIIADVADRANEGAHVLVAEDDDGRLVGSVTLVLDDGPYFEHDWGRDGDAGFRMLAADPIHRGHGVGRALIDACIDRAREAGRRRIVITTMPWMKEAQRLYESFGFVRYPAADRDYTSGRGLAYVLPLDGSPVPSGAAHRGSSGPRGKDC
jgi:GNAT superfamily N-acetyltransferase